MSTQSPLTPLLIIVHPGSLCGSADFNLGRDEAKQVRKRIQAELASWSGSVLVLHGDLSDELANYPALESAIEDSVCRASKSALRFGGFGVEVDADDPDHSEIALQEMDNLGVSKDAPILISGAWFDPTEKSGCINALRDCLAAAEYQSLEVSRDAARLSFGNEEVPFHPVQRAPR